MNPELLVALLNPPELLFLLLLLESGEFPRLGSWDVTSHNRAPKIAVVKMGPIVTAMSCTRKDVQTTSETTTGLTIEEEEASKTSIAAFQIDVVVNRGGSMDNGIDVLLGLLKDTEA